MKIKTKKRGLASIRFAKTVQKTKRQKLLEKRRKAAQQASVEHPNCQRLRSWLLKTEPNLMGFHERYTLIGCAFVALGFDCDELLSQPEQIDVLEYQKVQRRYVESKGHCLPQCEMSNICGGVCKHTGEPCQINRLALVIKAVELLNGPGLEV